MAGLMAKEVAKQIFAQGRKFVQEKIEARKQNVQAQAQMPGYLQQPNQYFPQNQEGYQAPYGGGAYGQQGGAAADYYNQSSNGQEHHGHYHYGHHNQGHSPQRRYSRDSRQREIREALREHNDARRAAPGPQRPDLQWDDRLARHAQRWADHLLNDKKGNLQHDTSETGQGENLFSGSGFKVTFKTAVQCWNEEKVHYHGQAVGHGNFKKYGHYTQVIWPGTTHVGMAKAMDGKGTTVVVARYAPQGNVIGRSAYG